MQRLLILLVLTFITVNAHAGETGAVAQIIVNEGPKPSWRRLLTKKIPVTDTWTEYTMSFKAPNSGKVQFLINSLSGVTWFDAITAENTDLVNGDFEQINDKGASPGWRCNERPVCIVKDQTLAKTGNAFMKVGKEYIEQWLPVDAGKTITLKIYIKSSLPPEDESALSAKADVNSMSRPATSIITKAEECVPRSGLPNFIAKCRKGDTIKIAYLGGSITCQKGWRVQSQELFKTMFPKSTFEEIYAAIGGTGANLGVFRLERDVIKYKPDLLFVEFATNGGNRQSMEGIVRNVWNKLPDCDICYVYTVAGNKSQKLLEEGNLNINAETYEKVAQHYGIPSIHMGLEAAKLAKAGKLVWKAPNKEMTQVSGVALDAKSEYPKNKAGKILFSKDGVHPYLDTGHKLYTAAIKRSINKIEEVSGIAKKHTPMPAPIQDDYVKNVSFHEITKAEMQGDWKQIEAPSNVLIGFSKESRDLDIFLPSVWRGTPGSSLSFKCKGSSFMLYTVLGPGTGAIKASFDGVTEKKIIFDRYGHVWRLYPVFFKFKKSTNTVHEVKIEVLDDKVDKELLLSQAAQEGKIKNNPVAYKSNDLLIGGICIEGGAIFNKN